MKTLSIIIAAYNEEKTIAEILSAIEAVNLGTDFKKEVIIVDDGSTDATRSILEKYAAKYKIFHHQKNRGKGAALRTGLSKSAGDFIIIQDADSEYDPQDYPKLLKPLIEGRADVIFGSRFIGSEPHRVLYFWHYAGNKILTTISNMLTNLNLTDMETGYKAFTRMAIDKILPKLRSNRFGIEPEITARVAQNKLRLMEVGISYHGRTYDEGKKINWKDGVAAIWHIIKFNLFSK